jgi:hypothetical protein
VFDGLVLASGFRGSRGAALQRKDDVTNFDFLPFLNLDLAHLAADCGRNLSTALSVSISMTGCPSETAEPAEIISRTKSPESIFSPSSGSLNSLGVDETFLRRSTRGAVSAAELARTVGVLLSAAFFAAAGFATTDFSEAGAVLSALA